uniref:Uncharacterized protein n=1 Tax=Glossina pallidipes TaxID=7398 RepID=A0A1A9ZD32_GLOPL
METEQQKNILVHHEHDVIATEHLDCSFNYEEMISIASRECSSFCHFDPIGIVELIDLLSLLATRQHSFMGSPDKVRGNTQDLFELLEKVQCSRLEDQRCELPAYFAQHSTSFNASILD